MIAQERIINDQTGPLMRVVPALFSIGGAQKYNTGNVLIDCLLKFQFCGQRAIDIKNIGCAPNEHFCDAGGENAEARSTIEFHYSDECRWIRGMHGQGFFLLSKERMGSQFRIVVFSFNGKRTVAAESFSSSPSMAPAVKEESESDGGFVVRTRIETA